MTSQTIERLGQLFKAMPGLVGGAVPIEEIEVAEKAVGITFDSDYREFILRYGGAVIGSLPVLGLRRAEVLCG